MDDPSRRGSAGEADDDAPVLPALVLDLDDFDAADFAGAADMRPAARLEIDAFDVEKPHAALAHRRLHRHGAHQLRPPGQFLVADPARHGRAIGALSRASPGTSKSSRLRASPTWPPVTAPDTTAQRRWSALCMRIRR